MRTVDLFSGCGGFSLGLQNAGMDILAAYENWDHAVNVYRENFDHDINLFDLSNTKKATKHIAAYKPDMIVGGPPCQDFSSAGKRDERGGRGDLTIAFAEIVVGNRPTWFVMENVERIKKTAIFKQAKGIFSEAGYGLTEMVVDASQCKVPQKRKRMFLIGRQGKANGFLTQQITQNLNSKRMTVRDYLGDSLKTEFYYRHARSYARRAIFSIDEPSPTIRGVNRPIPPNYCFHNGDAVKNTSQVRPLTFLERTYIQTFPKDFIWPTLTKTVSEQIIGNAVPVNMAKYLGRAILDYENRGVVSHTTLFSQPDLIQMQIGT